MESTLFDGEILFLKPSSTLFNIARLAALRCCVKIMSAFVQYFMEIA